MSFACDHIDFLLVFVLYPYLGNSFPCRMLLLSFAMVQSDSSLLILSFPSRKPLFIRRGSRVGWRASRGISFHARYFQSRITSRKIAFVWKISCTWLPVFLYSTIIKQIEQVSSGRYRESSRSSTVDVPLYSVAHVISYFRLFGD